MARVSDGPGESRSQRGMRGYADSKAVDAILWVIVAVAVAQLLWRLVADGKLWLGPLFLLLMAGAALALRLRRRASH